MGCPFPIHSIQLYLYTYMTTVLLVSSHDRTEYVGELNFTSEDTAHFYMRAEMPQQPYCFAHDEQSFYERF